jgi:hypothetical protein
MGQAHLRFKRGEPVGKPKPATQNKILGLLLKNKISKISRPNSDISILKL